MQEQRLHLVMNQEKYMGRTTFEPKNQRGDASRFPKIKLEKDQSARIMLVDKAPYEEWVHTLRAPKIVNGEAQTEVRRRRDGSEFTDYVREYVSRPLCLGDAGILADKGVDPKNCPICALANTEMTSPPERRFAQHVIEYAVKQGTTEVATPFQVSLKVWVYTERTFDKLVGFATEWGDLQKHDLLLGPCTNPQFQQFDINISPKAEWLGSDERKKLVADTYKENKITDNELSEFCGRSVPRQYIEDDLAKIRSAWAIVNASRDSATGADAAMESLDDGLDDLLTSQTGMDSAKAEEPAAEATPEVAVETPAPKKEAVDFDDLLNMG